MKNDNKSLLTYIPTNELYPHPDNPRKDLGDLTELADSIRAKGVMQNLTVVPRAAGGYTVIIGHRRMGASKLAGLTELPCVIVEMTEREQVATMLLENMQRSDLTVYEQAQGFQMMLDLGESVDEIAEKTGFSKTTVRRRLKMAELDQDVLKEVSGRQLSLHDFDKLNEIDDIEQRNECLKDIGTSNFNATVGYKLKKQNIAKRLPLVKAELKKLHANKISRSETYGGKYERVTADVRFYEWDTEKPLVEFSDDKKLYYCLDEDYGTVGFYVERPKSKPQKRPQAEIDREKYIADAITQLTELARDAYKLRSEFIAGLNVTSKNQTEVLRGAIIASALKVMTWVPSSANNIYEAVGVDGQTWTADKYEKTVAGIKDVGVKCYAKIIYATFGDRADNDYFSGYRYEYPKYDKNLNLDELYEWLISLGYEMSDEERQLRDGTHPLFIDKDAPPEDDE